LRKQAKRLAKKLSIGLAEAQRKLAAEYGSPSWAELMHRIATIRRDPAECFRSLADGPQHGAIMNTPNPVDLLFGGMEKLGPGGNAHTLHVLHLLPKGQFPVIVDAGCGAGRQTIALAKELGTIVQAVDSYEPFLNDLTRRAAEAGIERLVQTHCMDMKDIPDVFQHIDLLWSEGAAYNIGFANALTTWARAINPGGFAVVSELAWLRERIPDRAREFFLSGYPDMQPVTQNIAAAENAGYKVLDTYTLPKEAWVEGYYDILEPRAKALVNHSDPSVRDFARETVQEIEIFRTSEDSYGYVFYALQRV
jgi:SAM-dependent methyltransferase